VETTVFIVRHGITDWHLDRKAIGHRDVQLNSLGLAQAHAISDALAAVSIGEIISSPLVRAVQTAEILAARGGGHITRDARLADFRIGKWEALGYDEVAALPDYQRFVADPLAIRLPGGEDLAAIRDRTVGAVAQALRDAPTGERIAIVTHAGPARVILAHHLGMDIRLYHQLAVAPGTISVLSFRDDRAPPRLRVLGWRPSLKELV
jgi:broad specificity phosphatase PhoE